MSRHEFSVVFGWQGNKFAVDLFRIAQPAPGPIADRKKFPGSVAHRVVVFRQELDYQFDSAVAPDAGGSVAAGGENLGAVVAEAAIGNSAGVAFENPQALAAFGIPDAGGGVSTGGE